MNDEAKRMVGLVPDHIVAQVAGCSRDTVKLYRKRHGIPATSRRWRDEISDALASRIAALHLRRQEDLPKGPPRRKVSIPVERLGLVPDHVLGTEVGLSRSAIEKRRRAAGIKACPRRKTSVVDAVIRRLGLTCAADVAAETGCTLRSARRALARVAGVGPAPKPIDLTGQVAGLLQHRPSTSRDLAAAVYGVANDRTVHLIRRVAARVAVFSRASGVWRLR